MNRSRLPSVMMRVSGLYSGRVARSMRSLSEVRCGEEIVHLDGQDHIRLRNHRDSASRLIQWVAGRKIHSAAHVDHGALQ
jgi:hypothetical protein